MKNNAQTPKATAPASVGSELEDALDPCELADSEDAWLSKLRIERARRAHLDIYDFVELMGF